jgi:hypothetical protein
MNKDFQNELTCSQFEALLAEAFDDEGRGFPPQGLPHQGLPEKTWEAFEAHRLSCANCAPLFAEAHEGLSLLRTLEDVEPPRNLVHNILAATSRTESVTTAIPQRAGWWQGLRQSLRVPRFGFLHSRFVTSFCMAFFSLSLTLSLAGVRVGDLAKMDWHPSAVRRSVVLQYTQIEAKVMRYYDNMRLVYEVQSRVQQIKKVTNPAPNENNKENIRPDQQNRKFVPGTGRPEKEENYSQERDSGAVQEAQNQPAAGEVVEPTMNDQGAQL